MANPVNQPTREDLERKTTADLRAEYEFGGPWSAETLDVMGKILVDRGAITVLVRQPAVKELAPSRSDRLAGCISGTIVGCLAGGLGGWYLDGNVPAVMAVAAAVGLVVGCITAGIASVLRGAMLGPTLIIGMCLVEVMRRLGNGRLRLNELGRELSRDFSNPRFLLGLAMVLGASALAGAMMIGLRAALVRRLSPRGDSKWKGRGTDLPSQSSS